MALVNGTQHHRIHKQAEGVSRDIVLRPAGWPNAMQRRAVCGNEWGGWMDGWRGYGGVFFRLCVCCRQLWLCCAVLRRCVRMRFAFVFDSRSVPKQEVGPTRAAESDAGRSEGFKPQHTHRYNRP